jgi:hypothetical protein
MNSREFESSQKQLDETEPQKVVIYRFVNFNSQSKESCLTKVVVEGNKCCVT